ncbi:MAG: cbb3-type cytochrome c oxidase subunit I, partial [Dehalococcoidia bacterium]
VGSPNAGWFAYANLTSSTFSPSDGMDFYALGLLTLGVSSLAGAFNFIVTIVNMRAPGMRLMRMPPFVWMTLVTSFLLITAFPVITVGLLQILFDRNFGTNFFNPLAGASPVLWQHLFWLFGHPEVYILILPAMGIVSEIIPTFSRKPLFGYPFVIFSGILIGFLGWGVWSHHMFTVGLGPIANSVFTLTTMLIAIPTGVKIFNWIGTMWGGSIRFSTPMLFAVGFIGMFIIGGISGITHSSAPADAQQQDTYYIVAHLHYVLFGGSIMGLFAGIYYWFPKVTGRMMHDGMGKAHFWILAIGANLTFFPMHVLGLNGMPRRIYTYSEQQGWESLNLLSTAGAFLIAASMLIFVYNVVRSLRVGERAGNDPWDGRTLEWSITSPPPEYNFAVIPTVHSRDPFWDQKYEEGQVSAEERPELSNGPVGTGYGGGGEEHHPDIHMPSPSYFPIITAFGLGLAGALFIVEPWFAAIGAGIMGIGLYGWAAEPVSPEEH